MSVWGAVDGSLAHLVTTFATIPEVRVIDGQPLDDPDDPDVILVGFNPDRTAVTVNVAPEGMTSETVSFDMACLASVWRGDTDPAAVRTRLTELLDAAADKIAADRTLAGNVLDSRLELLELDQQQLPGGATATVAFSVRARTFA